MYFMIHEKPEELETSIVINVKNLEEAKEKANAIGKKYGFHHIHFHKWNAGTGSLQGHTHSFTTHCVTVK